MNRSAAVIRQPVFMAATLWLTPVLAVGLYGLGIPTPAALAIALVAAAVVASIVSEPLAVTLRPAESSRAVMIAVTVVTLVAIVQIARLSVFMGNVNRRDLSMDPSDVWRTQHCCLTAYSEAARFAAENTHNIYETSLYEPRFMDDLKVDPYHYPPAFLLLPRALQLVTDDFLRLRAVWFSIQALVLGGIALFLPWWIGGKPGAYALAGAVLFLATPQSLFSLQQGNFQTTAIAVAVWAFLLLWTKRLKTAAVLLAYVSVSKIFPGVLVLYLAAARRWREVAWIAVSAALIVALAVMTFGVRPFSDFIHYEIPRISNGDGFPQAELRAAFNNQSVYGLTVRLRLMGADWLDAPTGLAIASLYGFLILALTAYAGWKYRIDVTQPRTRLQIVQIALGLVVLGSFRSPFVGFYGMAGVVWLMTLLAADVQTSRALLVWFGGIATLCAMHTALPSVGEAISLTTRLTSTIGFAIALGMSFWAIRHAVYAAPRSGASPHQAIP